MAWAISTQLVVLFDSAILNTNQLPLDWPIISIGILNLVIDNFSLSRLTSPIYLDIN